MNVCISKKNSSVLFPRKMFLGNDKSSKSEELPQLFANFFQSVYEPARHVGANREDVGDIYHNNLMSVVTSQSVIETALKALDETKGPDPDGITPLFEELRC
ncbi:hypothetical protein WA026_011051 [Henosepilachna vigintioctopunctata]|uniref:Uncharacterized protein n=1 Tax=Henosepilachna vigintioctopunctata TaxID=420089 RepID=A0AAW1U090_9CUCU